MGTSKTSSGPLKEGLAGFVVVPAGEFEMGSPTSEAGRFDDEMLHRVVVSRSFLMKAHPVTQGNWKTLMGNNPSDFKGSKSPVENVSWFDAIAYCNTLSRQEGLGEVYTLREVQGRPGEPGFRATVEWNRSADGYRLPTEAEWEYACRAGTKTAFHSGDCSNPKGRDTNLDAIGWFEQNSRRTHPVGQKQANPWGLYDMSGNVWEWVWDWFGDSPCSSATDPTGPETGTSRGNRGGSWISEAEYCRSATRSDNDPADRHSILGFRIARSTTCR